MKCSVSGCKNKATKIFSINAWDGGGVAFCDDCLDKFNEHQRTREKIIK